MTLLCGFDIFKSYTRPKLKSQSQVFLQIDLKNDATPSPNPLRRENCLPDGTKTSTHTDKDIFPNVLKLEMGSLAAAGLKT